MKKLMISATGRLVASIIVGFIIGGIVGALTTTGDGFLVGIASATTFFVLVGTAALWPMSSDETKANASREDFNPVLDEVVITIAQLCGLGGIVLLQVVGGSQAGNWEAAIALVGVFMSWAGLQSSTAPATPTCTSGTGHPAASTSTPIGCPTTRTSSTSATPWA